MDIHVIVAVIVNSYLGFYGIIKIKIQILLKGLDKNYMISQALTSVAAILWQTQENHKHKYINILGDFPQDYLMF